MTKKSEIYKIILETEKALKIKYPYYELPSIWNRQTAKQKYITIWIPKSIINIEKWAENKMIERIKSLPLVFQREIAAWSIGIAPKK